jgi:hypothetical protein
MIRYSCRLRSRQTRRSVRPHSRHVRSLRPTPKHCPPCQRGRTCLERMSQLVQFASHPIRYRSRHSLHCSCQHHHPKEIPSAFLRGLHIRIRLRKAADNVCRSLSRATRRIAAHQPRSRRSPAAARVQSRYHLRLPRNRHKWRKNPTRRMSARTLRRQAFGQS